MHPNDDIVGDIEGISAKLDYLKWLGIDAIWLSPIYPSPMADYGYDISSYTDVDPLFGSLEDMDNLIKNAHARQIRVILDWVPNHTSSLHPWFQDSISSKNSAKRDWYIWRDPKPDGSPPNNWKASLTNESAWTFDENSGQYYLHFFLKEQPDLNWNNPEVVKSMDEVLRFWLDRGVDGFRIDVVHCTGKDDELADSDEARSWAPRSVIHEDPSTHGLLSHWRELAKSYKQNPVLIGEVFLLTLGQIVNYYGNSDELDLAFTFPAVFIGWNAAQFKSLILELKSIYDGKNAYPAWVLSNHDLPRHLSRFRGSLNTAKCAALMLLSLRGTPFVFQGEELGLTDVKLEPQQEVDPGHRDGSRAPIPWDKSPNHGWPIDRDPWLPWPPDSDEKNVEVNSLIQEGVTHTYKSLIELRKQNLALLEGSMEIIEGIDEKVLAYSRIGENSSVAVLINFSSHDIEISQFNGCEIIFDTFTNQPGGHFGGTLEGEAGVILKIR